MNVRSIRHFFILLIITTSVYSQFFYFGRNKVQYTEFDWHILKTEHFDIYYYPEMKDLAERGAFYAEESYRFLEEKFLHNVTSRIPLIFYSTHHHFKQTNVTPGLIPEYVGGFFEFLKGRVVIPYNGSMWDFRQVIRHELVHVFMHSKINRVLIDHGMMPDRLPPLWFVEGLAEYWSIQWDSQAEMVMRDAVINNYIVPLDNMERIYGSYLMYKEGQAILKFISENYGEIKILQLMENFWRYFSFEEVFKFTLGVNYKEFDLEWIYAMKKKYFPILTHSDIPSGASEALVSEGLNLKPTYLQRGNDSEIYFIGNHSGYTSIYRLKLNSEDKRPKVLIEGEKTDEFESFHLFQNKLDISNNGKLVFISKSGESDALYIFDIDKEVIEQTYQFRDLVVLGSPSWSPDGKRIVFSAVDKSGNNDLYIWDIETHKLERLTNDFYDDRDADWSPDGSRIAFVSDRTPYGDVGAYNLFLYEIESREIKYLTYGNHRVASPSWSDDGRAIVFTLSTSDSRNVWMMRFDSTSALPYKMKQLTRFTTAAFDPVCADTSLVFVAFENFSFQIRMIENINALYDSSSVELNTSTIIKKQIWKSNYLSGVTDTNVSHYHNEYSLDIAQSQISTDPVFGTAGGAFLAFSDLLGNDQYYFLIYNTAQSTDEIISSFNIAISRISLQRRANYAYGVYRFSGRRYDLTDPALFFYERVFGAYFTLSYPLSVFRRVELLTSISNSEKAIIQGVQERRALFLSNSMSFTHDNSLWGPSGPLDGNRYRLTLAYTTDIQYSNANYYSIIFDYRHYFRIALRSAYAIRMWIFYNDGEEARRFFMGGSWDLRGYPRWSLRGKKIWLNSHEVRFPFLDQIAFKFPFGGVTFFGVRGAVFFDIGSVTDDVFRNTYGSFGLGLRMNVGGLFVLRYDLGKRIEKNFRHLQAGLFNQFFFGWDF